MVPSFSLDIDRLFSAQGAIGQAVPDYFRRNAQVEMAQVIASAIHERSSVMVEAGTGTGKTFAYLVPALLWGGKVIISTGTKTLQDQLFERDLPAVRQALNVPVQTALLKGRANYVCHYWLERAGSEGRFQSRDDAGYLRKIQRFIKTTQSGDKAELSDVPENASIWPHVTSTRENCLGSDCPNHKECFVLQARRNAQQADVVVVNHHLFFADVMLRDEGMAELLPAANTVIFDEAHQLPDTATLFFGQTVSSAQLLQLCRDTIVEGLAQARDAADWPKTVAPLEKATRDLRLSLGNTPLKMAASQLKERTEFHAALANLTEQLQQLNKLLESQAARSEGLQALQQRAAEMLVRLQSWVSTKPQAQAPDNDEIAWVDVFASSVQLHRSPLSVAPVFQREREGYARAWIFTSATLAVKGDFSLYANQLGLQDAQAHTWPSPFNFQQQALLYVPQHLPAPQHPDYLSALAENAWPLIEAAGGRTFVLCTTLRAVEKMAELLASKLEQADIGLLKQGSAARNELLERFRSTDRVVLVGSQSFWEGVDVRGEALSLVIIDKLPFAPPDDPVLAARLEQLERQGGNPFMDYQIPAAAITLKQGAGRLIRSETDHGVLMIADPRLVTKPYGRKLWQALPPFTRTREQSVAVQFLRDCLAEK